MSNEYWNRKPGDKAEPDDLAGEFVAEERRALDLLKRTNDGLEDKLSRPVPRYNAPSGTFRLGEYSSNESELRAQLKAIAPSPEVIERTGRAIADLPQYRDVTGDRLDGLILADRFFRDATFSQLPRHREFHAASMRMAALRDILQKSDLYEATAASGGSTVPTIVANEILKIIRDASLIFNRARNIPMTSNVMNFPDENTAVTTNWVAEAGTMTGGEPVFGTKVLTAKKLAGRAVFSLELLDDGNVALMPFLQSCFAEKFGGELDFQAAQGPGTTFTGIRDAVSVGTTSATNGTNGTNITYAGTASTQSSLVKVFCGANEGMARNDGIFLCGPGVYAKIMGLVDLNGQPIVRLGTVEGQPNNTLFGRPIVVSARLTNYTVGAGTVSVGMLAYGSPSGLLFGVRQGMRWDVTDQVHWGTYQADARLVGRFAFVVGVPTAWVRQYDVIV